MRHTEPVLPDNEWRFLGRSDPPLSPQGIEHARALARSLRRVRFDSVFSSDMTRALQTAQIVADAVGQDVAHGTASVRTDPRLREIDTGLWEGLTRKEAAERYPAEHQARECDLIRTPFPGGESFTDLRRRVVPAFREIVALGGTRLLVVAHKGVNRVILCESLGLPLDRLFTLPQDYGAVSILAVPVHAHGG